MGQFSTKPTEDDPNLTPKQVVQLLDFTNDYEILAIQASF